MPETDDPILGGIHVCRPRPITLKKPGKVGLRLMSDLHFGAANVDYKMIQREVDDAAENGDRINLNGDVMDLILPKDSKRYNPGAIHPRLANRADPMNEVIKWCVEVFGPVAHLIDMIGIGNHEEKTTHWHGVDPTLLLMYELEKAAKAKDAGHVIHYGGYTGFIDYRVSCGNAKASRFVVYYHHGFGGAAPVTKGLIDFNRKDTFIDADVIWMGHKHNRLAVSVEKLSCPPESDQVLVRQVLHVMTGAYFNTYVAQGQRSVREHGRRSNYAADAGMAPQGKGGVRLLLCTPPNQRASKSMELVL